MNLDDADDGTENTVQWFQCDECDIWYHSPCVREKWPNNFPEENRKWHCCRQLTKKENKNKVVKKPLDTFNMILLSVVGFGGEQFYLCKFILFFFIYFLAVEIQFVIFLL